MLEYAFMQNALMVSLLIALLCPFIGVFLVVRRYSLVGDTLSHASLAGVTLALATKSNPIIGAFLFTSAAGALIEFLRSFLGKHTDLILSIVLALSVGVAITIMSSGGLQANAESFMFGSVLTVTRTDILSVAALCAASIAVLTLNYHKLLYLSFDEETARIAGVRAKALNYLFSILVAAAISSSIKIVGMLVLSSMIALPVATALQFGKGFRRTLAIAVLFSVIDIMAGLYLSWQLDAAPGGLTALASVAVLALVITARQLRASLSRRRRRKE